MESNNFINEIGSFHECPVTRAILELASQPDVDNFQKFKILIENSTLETIKKLLISTTRKGIIRNVAYIVNQADINCWDISDTLCEALHTAVLYHHNQIMVYLVEATNIKLKNDLSILNEAIHAENCYGFKFLLEHNAPIDNPKLLVQCCHTIDDPEIIEELFKTDIDFSEHLNEAFCAASMKCHIRIMNMLIKKGADISYGGNIALQHAVAAGDTDVAELLLKKGADVNVNNSMLILFCCKTGDNYQMLELLIKYGIDVLRHYYKIYNFCIKHKYMKSASVLVKYSYQTPLTLSEQKKLKICTIMDDEAIKNRETIKSDDNIECTKY